jgi:hypothetical protein
MVQNKSTPIPNPELSDQGLSPGRARTSGLGFYWLRINPCCSQAIGARDALALFSTPKFRSEWWRVSEQIARAIRMYSQRRGSASVVCFMVPRKGVVLSDAEALPRCRKYARNIYPNCSKLCRHSRCHFCIENSAPWMIFSGGSASDAEALLRTRKRFRYCTSPS